MSRAESREFKVSANMVYHLVFSQAGTVAKAIAELIMNSHDAGADTFELTIDKNGFEAKDNGHGFRSRKEIEDWFEQLGFDHSDELHKQEGRFSRFGLGRAQCMAFARTFWHTNTFLMGVDIKARGISYDLSIDQPQVDGCTVKGEWYEPMSFADIKTTTRELEELVAYARITVKVNGATITRTGDKWDHETDKVFIRRKETGGLSVYNQGVLVRTYPAYQYGSGIVVSKVPLILNIARNDILQSSCPVWKEVRGFLRDDAVTRSKKKPRLNDDERKLLIDQLVAGDLTYAEVKDAQLLEDIAGRKWKLDKVVGTLFTVHTSGSRTAADRIQQSKQAFVLAGRMLDSFGVDTPEALVSVLERIFKAGNAYPWGVTALKFTPIESLLQTHNAEYSLLKDGELTKVETVALKSLRYGFGLLQDAVHLALHNTYRRGNSRELYVGVTEHARAWTDGRTYVAINRAFLREHARDGLRGFTTLTNVLVHELCHESNTATGHDHGAEFFEAFHDVLCGSRCNSYGTSIRNAMSMFLKLAQKEKLSLTRNELRDFDREVDIERTLYDDDEFIKAADAAA